jgi:hypothetical protein
MVRTDRGLDAPTCPRIDALNRSTRHPQSLLATLNCDRGVHFPLALICRLLGRHGYDGVVLRFLLKRSAIKRLAHGFPVVWLLLGAEVAARRS